MSAATAYRTAAPAAVERFTFRRFSLLPFACLAAFWALMVAFLTVAFVQNGPAVQLHCERGTSIGCSVARTYPIFGSFRASIDDVRAVEREMNKTESRLVLTAPAGRLPISNRYASDEVRRIQQMRFETFLRGAERSLDLAYDRSEPFGLALVGGALLLLPLLLLLLDRSRIVLRGDELSITHVTAGVWSTTRAVPRARIVATRIDEREAGPGALRYRVVVALDSGEAVSVLRRESSDLERSEECLAWLRARVGES